MINNLKDQLIRDEDNRPKLYRDTSSQIGFEGRKGKVSIGVGRNLDDDGLRPSEVDFMLDNDIAEVREELVKALPWAVNLDEARLGVLLNMSFNMGLVDLLHFKKTLSLVESGQYESAGDEMLSSSWAEQVGPRAHRLSIQMKTGQWQ